MAVSRWLFFLLVGWGLKVGMPRQKTALTFGVVIVLVATVCWLRLTPAERWVVRHGWSSNSDLHAIALGQTRNLTWPLIDATIVSARGYVIVSLHDYDQTELLFAVDQTAIDEFMRRDEGQSIRKIHGSWYELRVRQ